MAEILRVVKNGDWYVVQGVHRGRQVSADIHASQVEERFGGQGQRALTRAVELVADYEESK